MRDHTPMPLASRVVRSVVAPPADPARGWAGVATGSDRTVVRFGACEFRRMDGAHGGTLPIGFPLRTCDRLQSEHDIATRWHNVFCMDYESLPTDRDGLLAHYPPADEEPDVVIVQIGAIYALRHALPERPEVLQLRDRLARRVKGPPGRLVYALFDGVFRRAGRTYRPYAGPERLAVFAAAVRGTWPGATVFVELPFLPLREGLWQRETARRVREDMAQAAGDADLEVVDHDKDLGGRADLRCLNGYNLSARGSAVVGDAWSRRLAALWTD